MATISESTTTRRNRVLAGCPCATAMVGRLPDEPTQELLYDRTDWPVAPPPALATSLPLPPVNAVAEALDDLALGTEDPSIYQIARAQLAAGVPVAFDGVTRWVDGLAVGMAPEGLRWPWPWECACKAVRCWHGALCDALLLADLRLAEDADTPVGAELERRSSYAVLLLVSGLCLLILWRVPFPAPQESAESIQALGRTVNTLIAGWSSGNGGYPR